MVYDNVNFLIYSDKNSDKGKNDIFITAIICDT